MPKEGVPLVYVRFEFKLQDMWVGTYWKRVNCSTDDGIKPFTTDIWICILPCLPIHITIWHRVNVKF